jgi:hypothetical protein
MDFSDLVGFSGVEKNALGGCSLSSINMGHNSNVTVQVQINFTLFGGRSFGLVNVLSLIDGDIRHHQSALKSFKEYQKV